jgi:hypothetical protein
MKILYLILLFILIQLSELKFEKKLKKDNDSSIAFTIQNSTELTINYYQSNQTEIFKTLVKRKGKSKKSKKSKKKKKKKKKRKKKVKENEEDSDDDE